MTCACEVCGQGPASGVTVYRTGGKGPGVNPHWRCECHTDSPIPDDMYEVTSIIENALEGAKHNG